MELKERIRALVAAVRAEYAPDPRLAVYDVGVVEEGAALRLIGAISEPAAIEALRRRVALLDGGPEIHDELVRLPAIADGKGGHALVTAPVAPMVAGPLVSEPHISQAVLGDHLLILRTSGRWLHVRSEDGYLGWMHRGYVARVGQAEARAWQIGAAAEVHHSLGAALVDGGGEVLARLPWGARLLRDGETGILPDGSRGAVRGDTVAASERAARFPAEGAALAATATAWLGTPYIWSGITPAGADCSGLVQAVFRMHGIDLPRDSDQQARVGEPVEPHHDLSVLRPGDLLFFAEEANRVSHVAISLGGSRIIHSSLGNGGVRRNDLAGETPLERELRRLLVAARRVVLEG